MDTSEDQFQEEVLQLFAEEGLEWIKQIKVALQELESGATPDKEKKHYDIILRCLTNLMGSVAKVHGLPKAAAPAAKRPVSPEGTYRGKIVQALMDLKHARPSALEPSRNLVELVLRRLHRLSDQESADVTAASIASILHQLEWLDVRFLQETPRRVGTLQQGLAGLKAGTKNPHSQSAKLQDGLREISVLYETARRVRAPSVIQVL